MPSTVSRHSSRLEEYETLRQQESAPWHIASASGFGKLSRVMSEAGGVSPEEASFLGVPALRGGDRESSEQHESKPLVHG
jgi:hypothetical protein